MSTEILKPEFVGDRHPDDNQLLLALERELSPGKPPKWNATSETAGSAVPATTKCIAGF